MTQGLKRSPTLPKSARGPICAEDLSQSHRGPSWSRLLSFKAKATNALLFWILQFWATKITSRSRNFITSVEKVPSSHPGKWFLPGRRSALSASTWGEDSFETWQIMPPEGLSSHVVWVKSLESLGTPIIGWVNNTKIDLKGQLFNNWGTTIIGWVLQKWRWVLTVNNTKILDGLITIIVVPQVFNILQFWPIIPV